MRLFLRQVISVLYFVIFLFGCSENTVKEISSKNSIVSGCKQNF